MLGKKTAAAALLLLAAGCADLNVDNPNAADRDRALHTGADVESLIAGGYRAYFLSAHIVGTTSTGAAMLLSVAADEHTASAANFAMLDFFTEPRQVVNNSPSYSNEPQLHGTWRYAYQGISAANQGLIALNSGVQIGDNNADAIRAKAFARFVQGVSYGMLARLYDRAVIFDETSDPNAPQTLSQYQDVSAAALKFLDEAITIANANTFTVPAAWINGNELTSAQFAQLAYSYKVRIRAQTARTPAERAAVNWGAVIADANKALPTDLNILLDDNIWWDYLKYYTNAPGWGWWDLRYAGMADSTGAYQVWANTPVANRQPFLLASPDARFPKANTALTSGSALQGKYVRYTAVTFSRPERGTYNWSNYRDYRYSAYIANQTCCALPELLNREVKLLKAEGLFRTGDLAGAAAIINETRVTNGKLNATNAAGLNTSCVPRLPDGSCGNLFEMLKWEKRVEVWETSLGDWFFDSRGWGDLVAGTPIQLPVPGAELEVLGLPAYTFGGVGGNCGAGSACTPVGNRTLANAPTFTANSFTGTAHAGAIAASR